MEKIWLKSYPKSIPAEVDLNEFSSIPDILRKSCQKFCGLPSFSNMGKTLSYTDLDRVTQHFAAYLSKGLGLKKGTRVAIMMPNVLQYPVALFGILRAGLTVVNTNPLYTPRELEHQLKDSGAEAIIILENFAATLQQVIGNTQVKHVIVTALGDMLPFPKNLITNYVVRKVKKLVPAWSIPNALSFKQGLTEGASIPFTEPELTHDDLAFLQYTGGTTGVAKGAMLTHGNIVANLQQASAWIKGHVREGQEVIITALPLYHIFSLTANSLCFMKIGGHNILVTNPRDFDGFIKILIDHKWTAITGVNTLFAALMNHPRFAEIDFSDVRMALGGGMAVQRAVAEKWKSMTKTPLVEAYGLTETSPGACANLLDSKEFTGMIGMPYPSTVLTIRDDDCNVLPAGQAGEICIAGPQVMRGYWNKPEETAKVMTPDGAFRTGDIGVMNEEGFFKIVDRKKDMILVSGFNVYPNEIEDVVAMHPEVLECCAVAQQDEKSGEVVRLVVVPRNPALTKESVMDHCRTHLTGYKLPKTVEFWKELPKSNVGKILRKDVRDRKAA
jgi:long-chain acyl-CoA synthetase